eukprot:887613-Pleurochrysis_carterae.AAC.1
MEKLAGGCELERTPRAAAMAARSSLSILAFCRLMAILLMASSSKASHSASAGGTCAAQASSGGTFHSLPQGFH